MNPVLDEIIALLDVEAIEENLFRGHNHQTEHVFGGQVYAQAIAAAYQTVRPEHQLHSTHGYFLRAGDWRIPILFEVDRIRDGRSFTTRRVVAIQHGRAIFNLASSWHKTEQGLQHASPIPDVLPPDSLRDDLEIYRDMMRAQPELARFTFRYEAIDSRQVENLQMHSEEAHPPIKHTWMRARERLPDSAQHHLALLAYMSDLDFMSTSLLPFAGTYAPDEMHRASLDHALWFHQPFRADEWLLFAKESPSAAHARGFVRGRFFTQDGRLVASAAQEALIRPLPPKG